ncbi:MAG: putative poly(glycerol-phosphate) alpha-glucosyltransferase [Bacteroidetes bacterium ADurb.Bin234]|nr:MAG: putative poly(glycerol-phosphate) alpha-glucosyltransferase [Bacteroidetes bacterium ADurb.Bin234]
MGSITETFTGTRMKQISKIVFIHSLNNYTGSPNVLSVVIKGLAARGYNIDLITSRGEGFLSDIEGINYYYTCYRWLDNKWKTAFLMLFSQLKLFFMILFSRNSGVIYYLNTITPFAAAWACRLSNKNFFYHVHENMQQEKQVYVLFRWSYKHCNRKSIFVSHYLKTTAINCRDGIVVYNALHPDFIAKAKHYVSSGADKKQTILMVASLRKFKGIYEFVEIAKKMPQYLFELVLSETKAAVEHFTIEAEIPDNLKVYSTQNNLHPFYRRAKLLLSLSHPEACIETFGLSILEAMVYGVPAIVPNVGGPTELIEDGVNGYHANPHDLPDIISKIETLMQNDKKYQAFSLNALEKSKQFNEEIMINEIENYLLK